MATPLFCSQCGGKLGEGAKFCPGCGTPVGAPSTPSVAKVEASARRGAHVPPQEESGCAALLIYLGMLLGGLGVLVFGLLLAGVSMGPGTPDPPLIIAGFVSAAIGVALMIGGARYARRCPKCTRWGGREPKVAEAGWPIEGWEDGGRITYFRCRHCSHVWREGADLRGDDPEYEQAVKESQQEGD